LRYDAQELIPASTKVVAKLNQYFEQAVNKPVYLCSSLLDPRIKTNVLSSNVLDLIDMNQEEVLQMFKDTAKDFEGSCYSDHQPSKNDNNTCDDESISSALFKKKKIKITSLQEEVSVYLDSECEEEGCQPLNYWKCNSKRFPTLAVMAQTYLAVSASSTPCERAFSIGRHIQDYSRNRMKCKTLESIICLQNWINDSLIDIHDTANLVST
jgi:hypothetical protein